MILEAERGLLSALINNPEMYYSLPFKITPEDFFERGNKCISEIIFKLINDGLTKISKTSITSTAKDMGLTEFNALTNDGDLVDDIIKIRPDKEQGTLFLKQVKKESVRDIALNKIKELNNYVENTSDPLSKIFATCEDTILGITSASENTEHQVINLADRIGEYIKTIGSVPGANGLDIGFPEWQRRVGGLAPGRVHLFIATNKTGKSSIGQRAAIKLSKFMPVLIVDTEMTEEEQMQRLICMIIKMPYEKFTDGYWNDPKHEDHKNWYFKIMQGQKEFETLKLHYLSARGRSVPDMVPAIRKWVIENKVVGDGKFPKGLIVYDYLKLTSYEELTKAKLQEYQKLGLDASTMKDFAAKYRIPIMTFGQTNREDDETINCLGASKRIADLVDSVTLFKEKTPEISAKDPKGSHLMRVFVARHGPATQYGQHIQIDFDKSIGQMEELGMYSPSQQQILASSAKKFTRKPKRSIQPTGNDLLEDGLGANDDDDVF